MGQELCKVGIIGGGPAGCACAYFINKFNPDYKVFIIDKNPMSTILPTGGGRCNLAYAEFDFRQLAKNYPRGEKFLYSVFSKFSTSDTIDLFSELGIKTYIQDDLRVFPISNRAKDVRDKLLDKLSHCKFIKEEALRIEASMGYFKVVTDMNSYRFDKLVCAIGGHNDLNIIKRIGVNIVDMMPSLVGLVTKNNFSRVMGVSVKNVYNYETGMSGDVLFTHFGLSGPLIYKISSLYARKEKPYILTFDFKKDLDNLQNILNNNPHKFIKNLLSEYLPMSLSEFILHKSGIDPNTKSHLINGKTRDIILENIHNFNAEIISTKKDGETVSAGGVELSKINPKTMEYREVPGLYFCGEILDIDGFCGGFNLQNCWSTAYVCATGIAENSNFIELSRDTYL